MSYNLTTLQNSTTLLEIITETNNNLTNGWLMTSMLMLLWTVLFISMKKYETLTTIRTASMITAIVAVLFYTLEWVNIAAVLTPVIIVIATIIIGFAQEKG